MTGQELRALLKDHLSIEVVTNSPDPNMRTINVVWSTDRRYVTEEEIIASADFSVAQMYRLNAG